MLSPSSCHSCVWIQASPLNFTNVAASTVQLALSLSRALHTQRIYLYATYVVCERLSVMHEPAGVVEILVQILTEYPHSEVQNTPPNENCQSPNPRVSEYPPQNENCQRVQIQEFQNTPPMKIVRESKSKSFRIQPPQNENCQRVHIREFQNTPSPIENFSFLS